MKYPNTEHVKIDANSKNARSIASEASLIRLHEFTSQEITRYRDIEWQVPSILIAFLLAFFTGLNVQSIENTVKQYLILRILFSILVIVLMLFEILFLDFIHRSFLNQRAMLTRIERKLKITSIAKPSSEGRRKINLMYPEIAIGSLITLTVLFVIWKDNLCSIRFLSPFMK